MSFGIDQEMGRPVTVKDEGLTLSSSLASIDFAGAGVTGSVIGNDVTETITGGGSGGVAAFTDLSDVPTSYSGHTLKHVRVNSGETALEFVTATGGVSSVSGSSVAGDIVTMSGTTGQVIQDSGYVLPTGSIVGTTDTQSLTNKTLGNTTTMSIKDTLFTVQDDGDATKLLAFQLSGITTGTTRTLTIPNESTTVVGTGATQSISNKTLDNTNVITLKDANFILQDDNGVSRQAQFQCSSITAGQTRTLTIQDLSGTIYVTGGTDVSVADGGTGASTAAAGFDALSPMTALGDIIFGGTSGTRTRLAGNVSTTKNFLTQTGVGASSAAPAWGTISVDDLSDAVINSPALNEVLRYNGTNWVNSSSVVTAAGSATSFFLDTTQIISAGSGPQSIVLRTIGHAPNVSGEVSFTAAVTSANSPQLIGSFEYDAALGGSTIDAGVWNFNLYRSVDIATGSNTVITNVYKCVTGSGTVTITGSGTSRTATASGGTPFVSGDANASAILSGYLRTTAGHFQISAFTSTSVVTIVTLSTYTNESAITYETHNFLFSATSGDVNDTSAALSVVSTIQSAFSINSTDKLAVRFFATNDQAASHVMSLYTNGSTNYTNFTSPLATRHNDLTGLQGGTSNQFYHLTSTEYSGTGTGVFARSVSPSLTTPQLGTATAVTLNGLTLSTSTGTISVTNGKTLGVSNSVSFSGTDGSNLAFGTGGTVAYAANTLGAFAATTSAQLASVISDETGTGSLVFDIAPVFSSSITVGKVAGSSGSVIFRGSTSGDVTVQVPAVAGTWSMTLPTNDGDSGQFLQTNGSGVTSWATASGSGGSGITLGAALAVDRQMAYVGISTLS